MAHDGMIAFQCRFYISRIAFLRIGIDSKCAIVILEVTYGQSVFFVCKINIFRPTFNQEKLMYIHKSKLILHPFAVMKRNWHCKNDYFIVLLWNRAWRFCQRMCLAMWCDFYQGGMHVSLGNCDSHCHVESYAIT